MKRTKIQKEYGLSPKRGKLKPPNMIPTISTPGQRVFEAARMLLAEIEVMNKAGEYIIRTQRVKQIFGVCAPLEGGESLRTSAVSSAELTDEINRAAIGKMGRKLTGGAHAIEKIPRKIPSYRRY